MRGTSVFLFLRIANGLASLSGFGLAYFVFIYQPEDPFAAGTHPAQPWLQHFHVLVVPLLVFAVGWIWQGHVLAKLAQGGRRGLLTGVALIASFLVMTLSGYGVQVVIEETWRSALSLAHLVSSVFWGGAWLGHGFFRRLSHRI